jgi:SAM-dependent methyltransferase
LEFTGERFTPECVREIRYEHFHRYAFALQLVRGKTVLDAACGEGYGSALLAAVAAGVTGVDLSPEAISHASDRYQAGNLSFRSADCLALPFADDSFDCVVSFETLEHLADHDGLLREFRRVLKPDGFLLLSSPDKAVYSEQMQNRNEFHVKELYRGELEALLSRHFSAFRLWGQKLLFQSAIWSLQGAPGIACLQESDGAVQTGAELRHEPVYFIALCAAEESQLPAVAEGLSLFDDVEESVYRHYYHEIRKNMAAGELLARKERELAELREQLRSALSAPSPRPWWRRLLGGG